MTREVVCGKEMGKWTVRLDGLFIAHFWFERPARRLAYYLMHALKE